MVAPEGWLIADGRMVSKTTYPKLWTLLGNTYGVSNTTSFYLPNGSGRVLTGVSTEAEFNTIGKIGGSKTHVLTIDQMPSHNHQVKWNTSLAAGQEASISSGLNVGLDNVLFVKNAGGDKPHNNLSPYLTVNYIIKY